MKRCMGCMEEYDDEYEVCPHCGYVEGSKPKIAYHIHPGEMLVYRYIIGKVLGYGSFGVTYLGWDCLLEKKVAIKEYLPNEFATRAEGTSEVTVFDGEKGQQFTIGKDKFSDEAKRLASFNKSRGIITVYDQFEDNGTSYIVMDYFEGETLQELINREGKIGYEQAINIVLPILNSLQEVHDAGIIHRDISPDNIYLTKSGEVKLLDFGAARYASTNMSKSLSAIYKQGFAPYEQYQSSREQGPWSDVYALAATMYYMITGIIPQESMNRLTKEDDKLEAPRKIDKTIPKNLSNAIMNAMIVYPAQRTQSVTEFKNEIDDIQTEIRKTKYPKKFLIPTWAKVSTAVTSALLVILCVCVGLGIIDISSILGDSSRKNLKKDETYTPGLINLDLGKAQDEADEANIVIQITDKVENEKVDADKIMTQDPKPGLIMVKDGLVNVVISKGEKQALVPDVTYMNQEQAKQELEALGFKVKIKEKKVKGYAKGTVLKQSVKANTEYSIGGTITLTVAKGEKTPSGDGKVQDCTNKKLSKAISSLKEHGLYVVVVERRYDDKVKEGCIISQNPAKGTTLKPGEVVEVVVSKGKVKVLVPDVQYMDYETAKTTLEQLGLKVEKKEEESDIVQAGKIMKQSVASGKLLVKGKTIKLTVSKGSQVLVDAQNKTNEFNGSMSISKDGTTQRIDTSNNVTVPKKEWSSWSIDASKANNPNYYVETKTQYSSRVVQKTSSNKNFINSEWSLVNNTVTYSNWVSGSYQRSQIHTNGETVRLKNTKTVTDRAGYYTYIYTRYRKANTITTHYCPDCGQQMYGGTWYKEWSRECSAPVACGYWNEGCTKNSWHKEYGFPHTVYYIDGYAWFYENPIWHDPITHIEYLYETRTKTITYYFEKQGNWSTYQDSPISASENDSQRVEVQTRTLYRYKQK